MVLAIETATPVCSVALQDGEGAIHEMKETGKGIHSEKLFLFIEELLKNGGINVSQISEVLISSGPGSYTGLRIAASAVKGLLFQRKIPVRTLGTLEAMAAGILLYHPGIGKIHTVIDARRQHLYYQLFEGDGDEIRAGKAVVLLIEDIDSVLNRGDIIVGTGLERLQTVKTKNLECYDSSCISAANLIRARNHSFFSGRFTLEEPSGYEPEYMSMGQLRE